MADLDSLINSKISLISHQDLRYDGTLFSINTEESSIVLKDGWQSIQGKKWLKQQYSKQSEQSPLNIYTSAATTNSNILPNDSKKRKLNQLSDLHSSSHRYRYARTLGTPPIPNNYFNSPPNSESFRIPPKIIRKK